MRNKKTFSITLRRTDFREADRIVNILTPEGKLSAIARGARRQKSKLAGGIEFFSVNEIVLSEGKSEMRTIISARMKEFFGKILKDFDKTDFAYSAMKIVNSRSENIESPEFFDLLVTTFESLNTKNIELDLIESWFKLKVSFISGEEMNLHNDKNGDNLNSELEYNFDSHEKVFVLSENGKYDKNHIKFLRLMMTSEPKILTKIIGANEINSQVQEIILSLGGF